MLSVVSNAAGFVSVDCQAIAGMSVDAWGRMVRPCHVDDGLFGALSIGNARFLF